MIRLIIIFALIYLLIRLVGKALFAPSRNVDDRGKSGEEGKEGDITIQQKNPGGKKIDKNEGDYIDYEELNE